MYVSSNFRVSPSLQKLKRHVFKAQKMRLSTLSADCRNCHRDIIGLPQSKKSNFAGKSDFVNPLMEVLAENESARGGATASKKFETYLEKKVFTTEGLSCLT